LINNTILWLKKIGIQSMLPNSNPLWRKVNANVWVYFFAVAGVLLRNGFGALDNATHACLSFRSLAILGCIGGRMIYY